MAVAAPAAWAAADPTPDATTSPTSTASPTSNSSPTVDPSTPSTAAPRIRTNLQAVFDPIAVKVGDRFRVRVGIRNAGPRTVSTPGTSAVTFQVYIADGATAVHVRSLGGCFYQEETPPDAPTFIRVPFFICQSGSVLRAGDTFWQSFLFPNLDAFDYSTVWGRGVQVAGGSGAVDETDLRDNTVFVKPKLGHAAPGLPVTGVSTISMAAGGVGLVLAGAIVVWLTRRRPRLQLE